MPSSQDPRFKRIQPPDQVAPDVDLVPKARTVGAPFQQATVRDTQDGVVDNQMLQLSRALSDIQPSLTRVAAQAAEQRNKQDEAEGKLWQDAQSSKEVAAQMVREGKLPAGKSPWFYAGLMTRHMETLSHQYDADKFEAWKNSDARTSDDHSAYEKWSSEYRKSWTDQNLAPITQYRPDADVQIAEHFNPRASQTDQRLSRIQENENLQEFDRKANDQAQKEITGLFEDFYFERGPGVIHDPQILSNRLGVLHNQINAVASGPDGYMKFGFTGRRFNDNLIAAAINYAKKVEDVTVLDAVEAYSHSNGSPAKTAKARQQLTEAREHITSQVYNNVLRTEKLNQMDAEGTPEQRIADYAQRYRSTQDAVVRDKMTRDLQTQIVMQPKTQEGLAKRDEYLLTLKQVNPTAALDLEKTITAMEEHQGAIIKTRLYGLTEMHLQNAIIANPSDPKLISKITQAFRDETIDVPTMRHLIESAEKMRTAMIAHGALKDPAFLHLEEGVGRGVVKDFSAYGGKESIAMANATFDFRMQAVQAIQDHPELAKNGPALAAYMQPKMKEVFERYNESAHQERVESERTQAISQSVVDAKLAAEEAMKKDHEKWWFQGGKSGIKAGDVDKVTKEAAAKNEDPEVTKGKLKAIEDKAKASLQGQKDESPSWWSSWKKDNAPLSTDAPKTEAPAPDLKTNTLKEAPVGTKVSPKGTSTKGAFTKEESSTLMDALDRYYHPAKDQQPLEKEDVQAIVRGVLAPRYPDKKDLERATNTFIEANKNRKKKS